MEVKVNQLMEHIIEDYGVLVITISNISSDSPSNPSFSRTISNARIKPNYVVVHSVLSSPSVQVSDWVVTTTTGSLTISGSIKGTTNITLYLSPSNINS